MSEVLLVIAIGLAALSGLAGLNGLKSVLRTDGGQRLTTLLAVLASLAGLAGVGVFWAGGDSRPLSLPWAVPGGEFLVGIDAISAVFLVPIFLVSLLGNVYGLGYWKEAEHPENARTLRFFYGTLTAGMALLVIAQNGLLLLFGWEIMALSGFFLVTTEDRLADVRRSGWIYLVATHVAAMFLFALVGLLRAASGSYVLESLRPESLSPGMATAIFVCALVGFGLKAGIMPLHIWLPGAHANAPSHVSAIMSGVILKMGIYGLVRMLALLPLPPLAWGYALLGLGVVSGVLGVAFAVGQHDLKRLLAYHSIENIGIIVMGLGLALIGRTLHRGDWVILGLGGALLHVWNHALFKSLLFFSAGSVVHAAGTRHINRLGGLAKAMPRTALGFLVGAIAICGLPPLNGFVSELLIYLGLFRTLGIDGGAACPLCRFAAPALALIGGLAVACFVKVYGVVFLGTALGRRGPGPRVALEHDRAHGRTRRLLLCDRPLPGTGGPAPRPRHYHMVAGDRGCRFRPGDAGDPGLDQRNGTAACALARHGLCRLAAAAPRGRPGRRQHLGLRLRGPHRPHAIHGVVLRGVARGAVPLGAPAEGTSARGDAAFPQNHRFREPRARRGAR